MVLLAIVAIAAPPARAGYDSPFWSDPVQIDSATDYFGTNGILPVGLNAVSCPTARLCVAVDPAGNVVTSTDPAGGSDAWSMIHVEGPRYSGGPFPLSGENALNAVSCPSTRLCVAIDASGNVLTSTDPAGGASAWTTTRVVPPDGSLLSDVSCPTTRLCVVADERTVITSTDPIGGARTWKRTRLPGGHSLGQVSCPTVRLCVAAGEGSRVATSTDPAGGARTWRSTRLRGRHSLHVLSCPTSRLCVGIDGSDHVVTSTHPASGARTWRSTPRSIAPTRDGNSVDDLSCPTRRLCVATDIAGRVHASIDPTGGARAWSATLADGNGTTDPLHRYPVTGLTAVSCPTPRLCVAVDNSGYAVTSTDPSGPTRQRAKSRSS